ncbi:MAG TPA: ABC transporter permease [Candidatus Deferrimicrobium sp.]|nr:ABC transporter permease [Candidatus Deferrimicrobium sp.]
MFRGLWAILKKEIIHIKRDPATRFVLAIPLIELLLFGYAIDTDVKHVPTVVLDFNQDAESRLLVNEFENTRYFKLVGDVHSDQELQAAIVSGRAKVGIKIPPDYSANLLNGRQGQVQVIIDGSDSTTALQILNASQQLGFLKSLEREGVSPAMFSVDVRPRLLFNPNLQSANFFVPGLIGIVLQLVTVFLTAFAIVRERERGTLEQLLVTPVSKGGLILGKLLPYTVIGFAQTVLVLLVMVFLFGVPINGSVTLLLFLSLFFLVSALGIGIVISTFARNQGEAMQLSLMSMLPAFLLSGFVFPRDSMPLIIYIISLFIPATYYLEILRGIILRGAGIAALWDEALVLAAFGVFFMVVSALRFKKHLG